MARVCLLAALLVYDQVQNALNGQANLLFAGWGLLDLTIVAVPGIALVLLGLKISSMF